jgi:hypothetical protein
VTLNPHKSATPHAAHYSQTESGILNHTCNFLIFTAFVQRTYWCELLLNITLLSQILQKQKALTKLQAADVRSDLKVQTCTTVWPARTTTLVTSAAANASHVFHK